MNQNANETAIERANEDDDIAALWHETQDAQARKERTYSGELLAAVQRLCRPFRYAHVGIYPDGTAFALAAGSAIWIQSARLRGLDVQLPLAVRINPTPIEAIETKEGTDLAMCHSRVHCQRATSVRGTHPDLPTAAFAVKYLVGPFRETLAGDPLKPVELRRGAKDPWRVILDRHELPISPSEVPDTTHFGGWAERRKLQAVLVAGARGKATMQVIGLRHGHGVMTTVKQRVARNDVTITRLVALRP